jgi:prepilin-type N-terminal cleavage/methylation domain-containing protein
MKRLRPSGYTLIEVLTAAIVVGVGMSAAVSMSSTMMLQEELSWRVAVAMNYQENTCRLWQLGLSPTEVAAVMPDVRGHPFLNEILDTTASIVPQGIANQSGMGVLEGAIDSVQVGNFSNADNGSNTTMQIYRATTVGNATEP